MDKKKDKGRSSRSEYPEDIPIGRKNQMSWKDYEKIVLRAIANQGNGNYCWNIASSAMLSAHLYIHDREDSLLSLSARHLFVGIEEKISDGTLKKFEPLKEFLINDGLILEEECHCVIDKKEQSGKKQKHYSTRNPKADPCFGKMKGKTTFKVRDLRIVKEVDEKQLIELLHTGPVCVSIDINDAFKILKGDEIFRGCGKTDETRKHVVLLTGYGTNSDGVHFWEFQNSYGVTWGKDGFGRFIRHVSQKKGESSLILEFFYPELLDRE